MELIRNIGQSDSVGAVIVLSGHERTLLDTVAKMAHAYGVKLLGAIDKPLSLNRLQNILDLSNSPAVARDPSHQFSVDEILYGIRQGQFEAFFQPKVSLSSGLLVGAEALARWRHPEHGLIGPNAFIPALEQAREIEELTFLMLKQAALACRHWAHRSSGISVSVNISLVSLGDPALADQISAITSSVNLDPSQMVLEITETAAIGNIGETLENFVRLRMRGFGLSMILEQALPVCNNYNLRHSANLKLTAALLQAAPRIQRRALSWNRACEWRGNWGSGVWARASRPTLIGTC